MTTVSKIVRSLPGYKISGTHFRIGTKIHISDFYYAKRFFQNGFFASRVAYLLAKDIIEVIHKQGRLADIERNGLTIIGYEMYSALLISLINKFLITQLQSSHKKINHNLFEDVDNLKLCKLNNLHSNVVIIVPIASTFSTAIKLEREIQKIAAKSKNETYVLQPHFNVIYISDGEPSADISPIEQFFNWQTKNVDEKIIEVNAFYGEKGIEAKKQAYRIPLPTSWHLVDDCKLCNPSNILDEEPLYETDKTAVTPSVIFSLPEGRLIDEVDLKRKYLLKPETITYGHHTRNNSHFLYAINTELFLEDNRDAINDWLNEIKISDSFRNDYKETDRVIIISSSHYSNAEFISIINDILFSSSANIIHHNPENDFIQNFNLVYGKEINNADKIYFVDDSLKSGRSYGRIYQFVKNILKDEGVSINGCFFLVNKAQSYTINSIKRKMGNDKPIYAFANLHLYTSLNPNETSPLLVEADRYRNLELNSFLDCIRVNFQKQSHKLSLDYDKTRFISSGIKSERHLNMLIATHRIYHYFTIESTPVLDNYYLFLGDLIKKTVHPLKGFSEVSKITSLKNDVSKSYLKVLTQSPFNQYKPLKDRVFRWVQGLTKEHIEEVSNSIKRQEFDYDQFEILKFLFRRVGLLNSNLLISNYVLNFLKTLYSENGIPKLLGELKQEIVLSETNFSTLVFDSPKERFHKLQEFQIFFVAQIKELLMKNESRCIPLETILKKTDTGLNAYVGQIFRMLREENAIIIKTFYDYISLQSNWSKIFSKQEKSQGKELIDFTNKKINNFLKETSVSKHHKFQTLNSFFDIIGKDEIIDNEAFQHYLWLKYFLQFDKNKKELNLQDKTEYIMHKIMQIISSLNYKNVGAFFIINDNQKKPFTAYNRNLNGTTDVDAKTWDSWHNEDYKNSFLKRFFYGENKGEISDDEKILYKTIVELERTRNTWTDMYATNGTSKIDTLESSIVPLNSNRLLLVRLSKELTEETQGIMGFYYKNESNTTSDVNINRYLLLLRSSLSKFITTHHENDEFRDWQIASIRQKTSLLTGHGRDMLMRIASNANPKYKDIVYTLLMVQRFIIDKHEESDLLNIKSNSIAKMFKDYYKPVDNEITVDFITEISTMARQIFEFKEIENEEQLDNPIIKCEPEISFKFDKDLLQMICFELLVNAKKNRWIFLEEEEITTNDDVYIKNRIWIDASESNQKLIITISNSGPQLLHAEMAKVKSKKNIKENEITSGIELISTLLNEFNLGEISFEQKQIKDRFYKFSAKIELNEFGRN